MNVSRRGFLAAALGSGVAVAVPYRWHRYLHGLVGDAVATDAPPLSFFTAAQYRTCVALCSRVVPTGADPHTDPGATEMHAALFIDRFLSAFEPSPTTDNPAVYLHGRFTKRNAYPDHTTGRPSNIFPADATIDGSGTSHFLELTPLQTLAWRAQLYGVQELDEPWVSKKWRKQVGTLLPVPVGLRTVYRDGLKAFDTYSRQLFGRPFADAAPAEQDLMIEAAGNVIVSQLPIPAPVGAPDAAKALFPQLATHTFQGTYGLPAYRGEQNHAAEAIWRHVGWDGDTMPLGNSVYWDTAFGPGEGPNAGFGDPATYQPRGTYREYRPVSSLDLTSASNERELSAEDVAPLIAAWKRAGIIKDVGGGAK